MKTIKDFKARLQTGVLLNTKQYRPDETGNLVLVFEWNTRPITKVQTNGFSCRTTRATGEIVNSWCYYETGDKISIVDNNTVRITSFDDNNNIWSVMQYTFVEGV